ncbi:phospholipase membrane-associated-like [Brachionus plicatilis]|uniref:Phospholipase B1, membrane-associated n=1 Tax=Brachionus plicatilis TaxID=10195 RepID=A0A3M7SJF1_BRAPC|nr:phospholipase membrane-associated-like [Brachionus plicatilis]
MKFFITFVLLCCHYSHSYKIDEYTDLINQFSKDSELIHDFEANIGHILETEPNYFNYTSKTSFTCDLQVSDEVPTSVHKLKPGDIKVVAALGDSLTASLGSNARTILGLLIEYRGRSWSIGGNQELEKLLTLPNLLKKFNPNLKGFSVGKNIMFSGKTGKGLNVAVSGQEANHVPEQASILIDRLRSDPEIDFQNDWKLVTIFVGGNDLCDYCNDRDLHNPLAYATYLQHALDLLYKEVPRVFVNLVSVLNVNDVKLLNKGLICSLLHKRVCPCAAYPESAEAEKELSEYIDGYHNFTEAVVNSGRFDGRDDFAVVVQPFFKEFRVPRLPNGKVDFSYFAPDCFHFSTKGQTSAAIGLWNNMLQPVGKKSTIWRPQDQILCPTKQHPYLFTRLNSN